MIDASAAPATPEEILAFPASVAQQSFWYLELLDKNASAFNVPLRYRIDGPLDRDLLASAIGIISSRHEILRTHFEEENGELLQIVTPPQPFGLAYHDLSSLPGQEAGEQAELLGTSEANRCFSLSRGPLFRAELVRLSTEKHLLHLTFHHAIFDGLSIGIFIRELAEIHASLAAGQPDPLPPLPIQYGDYSVWQKELLATPEVAGQLAWWKENLSGMAEPDLPSDRPRPPRKSWKGNIVTQPLPDDLIAKLHAIANRNSASLFHIQLAAFKLLLQRYTGSDDISVGTPIAGRTNAEVEPLIGVFINSLIIRTDLSGNPTFGEILGRVRDSALQAIDRQDLPFENLVRELRPERDPGRNPLFQINFSQDRFTPRPTKSGPITITPVSSRSPGCIFDLHFFLSEREGAWKAGCDYSTDLFDRSTAERILGHYRHLLEQIAADPSKPAADFDLLTTGETENILGPWKGETTSYPRDRSIGGLFAETARLHPEKTALIHRGESITYARLHARASSLAAELVAAGVEPGDLVALAGCPSPALIAGMIAILLTGGAYVPLNPADPAERVKLLLEECGARFLLTDGADIANFGGTVIDISRDPSGAPAPELSIASSSPAYLMFTSGSTGTPKGVLVPHRAVVRLVKDNRFMRISPDDVFLQAAPPSFDASTLEIWGPLLNGGSLVIPEGGTDLDRIASAVREQGVTALWLTAGLFNLMIEDHADSLKGLRYLLAGGDVLSVPHVKKALSSLPGTVLINGYGPTENTTFTTCHTITPADAERPSIPIGKAISNTTVHILDAKGRLVPTGVPGELHTGGDGLAIGYHNDPALTAEKFIVHPQFGRLYRTGDLCRWLPDGGIEFLGRTDHQVKVRGFRIEPGEIESVLGSHPSVREAKVAVRGSDAGDKRILGWVRPAEGISLTASEIASFLSQRLPPFMCPDAIGIVGRFPVTANGKIDTRALPDPVLSPAAKEKSPPVGDTETRLAALWCELLGIGEVNRDDVFFDLGGHSLMALRLFSRINREFSRSLPLSALISHPTIAGLAVLLEPDAAPADDNPAPGKGRLVKLSPANGPTPLICIHGGDGGILFYRDLASRLPSDIPIHAIESVELDSSDSVVRSSVEETADSYVSTLLATQPEGPFRLAGYSFGGVVAHEMARILSARGHKVDFLGLLDTHNPSAPHHVNTFPERVAMFWKNHGDLPLLPRLARLVARFSDGIATHRRVKKEIAAAKSDDPAEAHGDLRRVRIRQENWRAMQAYKPLPFSGKITLFKAKDQSDKVRWPDDYGWRGLGEAGFEIVPVSGKHLTLFEPENVGNLAEALAPELTRPRG